MRCINSDSRVSVRPGYAWAYLWKLHFWKPATCLICQIGTRVMATVAQTDEGVNPAIARREESAPVCCVASVS
jgi:hypothetical protein